jgi:hypothetical protein
MTVMAAPLTASCFPPLLAPPEWSKSLEASAIAILISCVCELPPALPPPPPPDVNFLNTCGNDGVSDCGEFRTKIRRAYLEGRSTAQGRRREVATGTPLVDLTVRVLDRALVDGIIVLVLHTRKSALNYMLQ